MSVGANPDLQAVGSADYIHKPGSRLLLFSIRTAVTIPPTEHQQPLATGVVRGNWGPPRIQDWQSTKNRRLEDPIPYVLLQLLLNEQESRAVARKPRHAAAVLFGLKFANDIHYKFKSSYASFEARLQSSKYTCTKQNLTQNGDSRSFKVTCFGVSGKAMRH